MVRLEDFDVSVAKRAQHAPLAPVAPAVAACTGRLCFVAFAPSAAAVQTTCSSSFLALSLLWLLGVLPRLPGATEVMSVAC